MSSFLPLATLQTRTQQASNWLICYCLPLGWLILLTGMFWIGDRSDYHKLFYATLALPTLIAVALQPSQIKLLLQQPLIRLFLLFSAYILLSVLWAGTDETPLSTLKRPLYLLMLLFAACLISLKHPGKLERTTQIAAVVAVLCAGLSLGYFFYEGAGGRFSGYGALYNPLLSSHVFGFFCAYWLSRWYLDDQLTPLLPLVALAVLWALLVFTGSRTPLLALSACILWLATCQWKPRILLVIAAAIGMALAAKALLSMAAPLQLQVDDLLTRGMSFRPAIWQEVLRQLQDNLWLGLGYTHPQVFHVPGHPFDLADTHNIELAVLFCGGIAGLTLWLLMYAYAMTYAWQRRQQPAVLIASTLVVFGFFAGLTEGSAFFSRPKEQWFLIWIPLALLAATRLNRKLPTETAHGSIEKV
ncbi:MAG: O-antigen ligase family protein [Pseudomonadaceae bacterium]|jgi:O-antigen ligase|nr:O-antigen ligase family protein [Pseudomonadaceae bacterium]